MYSQTALDHFYAPRHAGSLDNADVTGREGTYGQGPFMVLYLRLEHDNVVEARFQTYGCPAAIACGSWLCEWLTGRTMGMAEGLTAQDIDGGLGGLPLGKDHCPRMALESLRNAMAQYKQAKSGD